MMTKFNHILHNNYTRTAFTTVLGLCGLIKILIGNAVLSPSFFWSILSILVIAAVILAEYATVLLMEKDGKISRKISVYAILFGFLFGTALDMGFQLKISGVTAPGLSGKGLILLAGLCFSFLLLPANYRIFRFIEGLYAIKPVNEKPLSGVKTFLVSWLIMALCWTPAYLAYYPAIMSYDFNRQFWEAVRGYVWFYEYQPLAHTFLIRIFYLLGENLGDPAVGMAIFSALQALLLSASVSLGLAYLRKVCGRALWFCFLICFALLPFHPVLALSMTKDILFSSFFVLIILVAVRIQKKLTPGNAILFLLLGILNILFRNNAVYGLVFLVPAFFLTEKGMKKKLLCILLSLVTILSGLGCKTLIRTAMNAIPGPKMEAYNVPIMQFVRVTAYQNHNLTEEQRAILERYVPADTWGDYTYPNLADHVKLGLDQSYGEAYLDTSNFLRDYLTLGKAYPNDYVDAVLQLSIGYWFIDDKTHAEMLGYGDDTNMGLLYTFNASVNETLQEGIPSRSFLPGLKDVYSHIVNGNSYYNWPVISLLMKPAFYFWLFILGLLICFYKKNKKSIVAYSYPLFYLATMFLGPCVNFRYIYPFVAALPLLLAVAFAKQTEADLQ